MTSGILEPHHHVDASLESLQRTLDLARRALHAHGAAIVAPDGSEPSEGVSHGVSLAAKISVAGEIVAMLVVHDAPERQWSDDDRAMLDDIAASLAAEIGLRGDLDRQRAIFDEARRIDPEAAAHAVVPVPDTSDETAEDEPGNQEEVHILLADDLDLNRKLICDMLSLDGYIVDSVADGAAAVEAVKAKVYDLVLMDMIMPGMDGMDATRAIRALPSPTCDVPIVALTAHSFREQLDNCILAGMNATLTKPMSFDALTSAVSTWAKSRRHAA